MAKKRSAEARANDRKATRAAPADVYRERDLYSQAPIISALSGVLYALFVIGLSGGMLLINSMLCLSIYAVLPKYDNVEIAQRAGQMFFFIAPVVLMLVEWNLLDRVQRLLSR